MGKDAGTAGKISLQNKAEFLEGEEAGEIRKLDGFNRAQAAPTHISESAKAWCQRLLADRVAEEIQNLYASVRKAFNARRKDVRKSGDTGSGDLDAAAFRYWIETGQNLQEPGEYIIRRRLELREGWDAHRAAIGEIFGRQFDRLVIEFERMDDTFDALVEKLDDIKDSKGGEVEDDDRSLRASYKRDGVTFVFDLKMRRLEISLARGGTLELIDAANMMRLGLARKSPLFFGSE